MSHATWVLESDVFPESHAPLRQAVKDAKSQLVDWDDAWWSEGVPSGLGREKTLFHGSLGNAARIADTFDWEPGSFCNTARFCCSAWYEHALTWLLHEDWRILPANDLVASAKDLATELDCAKRFFVRPDSPLKPFSGRVLEVKDVSLRALDHGFYFDDEALPVVVAPVRSVGREWRFVIVHSEVVAGSAYDAEIRSAIPDQRDSGPWAFANSVASAIPAPADAYVLDVCEADGELRLLELNPFGGADLYACDAPSIVEAISSV